jgi:transcriptional regulator with XRE-family HTH domain
MIENQYVKEGGRVKEIRIELGKKPKEMAELMNITVHAYYKIELGNNGFSMNSLKVIASLGGNLNYLFTGEGSLTVDAPSNENVTNGNISKNNEDKKDINLEDTLANLQRQINELKLR